ncbi:hypothetical protein Saso_40970 [Streptomyces asoensis]|uniref:Uncharacterized protein n=1 Tax=Streptomyces asoensis TaxID=249586 RepID=A0ABQ3S3A1_9ACTN|nr:hypothetical protein GCM10010496_62610 [Streptomyces asoensis]GHI62447.1 hypothetical protein Saso_40970 [Streptomyces asoensis]
MTGTRAWRDANGPRQRPHEAAVRRRIPPGTAASRAHVTSRAPLTSRGSVTSRVTVESRPPLTSREPGALREPGAPCTPCAPGLSGALLDRRVHRDLRRDSPPSRTEGPFA